MSYPDACRRMTTAINRREEAIEELIASVVAEGNTWHWYVPPEVQLILSRLAGAQITFKSARAQVLGTTGNAAHSAQNQGESSVNRQETAS